jgi:hypothetical protein
MPLSTAQALPGNPKSHDVGAITQSMGRFGFLERVVVNRRTGHTVSGHGRLETLAALKRAGESPPVGVVVRNDDEWLVPVDYVTLTEQDERAAAIALNRLVTLGGWDDALLATMLQELAAAGALAGVGYDGDDVDALLKRLAGPGPPVDLSVRRVYQVIVTCRDEAEQHALLERFAQEGLDVKALII